MQRQPSILMLLALGLWACSGGSASGKASGSAEFGLEGSSWDANASASAEAGGNSPPPASPGSTGWVGTDPCGVPDEPDHAGSDENIALEEGNQPDSQYVGAPVATLPAFRMLPGGCSRVMLEMRGAVSVVEKRAPGRLSFRLTGVQVPVKTNRFDLPTEHFDSPVGRIHLMPAEDGAELVIELRSPARSKARLQRSPRGMLLRVDFRPASDTAAERPAAQLESSE